MSNVKSIDKIFSIKQTAQLVFIGQRNAGKVRGHVTGTGAIYAEEYPIH